MIWTDTQIVILKAMAYDGATNAGIAAALKIDVNDVYAKRSQLGITVPKVAEMDMTHCDCCGSPTPDDDERIFIMPNGDEMKFCDRCAMVSNFINNNDVDDTNE